MMLSRALPALVVAAVISPNTMAEFKNESFSVFGAAGFEYVHYSEDLKNFAGQDLKSQFNAVNFVQRSGGYTAVNERLGFFITTGSTLIAQEEQEDWNSNRYSVPVQQDTGAMNFNTVDLMMAYHLQNGWYLTGGMHYQKIAFSRFDWRSTSSTESFADDIETYIRNTPSLMDPITSAVNNGDYTEYGITTIDEYFAETRFKPEETQAVVFEDASSFGALFGIAYDSYFVDRSEGIRYVFSAALGTQVYERVLNSSEGRSLHRAFGGGLDAQLKMGIGYQISPQLALLLVSDSHYSYRDRIDDKINSTTTVTLPANTFYATSAYLSIRWNFQLADE